MSGKFASVLKSLHFIKEFGYDGVKKSLNNGTFSLSLLSHAERGQTELSLRFSFFVCFLIKRSNPDVHGVNQHSSPVASAGIQQVIERTGGRKVCLQF